MGESKKDPIPEHFDSAEEAGEFWDAHSAADYWDEMEEVEMEFDLQKRVFLVPLSDHIYYRVKQRAEVERRSVEEVVSTLLERELT
jgi:vacuolar-type H+-ATPase subunit C/Vma6